MPQDGSKAHLAIPRQILERKAAQSLKAWITRPAKVPELLPKAPTTGVWLSFVRRPSEGADSP